MSASPVIPRRREAVMRLRRCDRQRPMPHATATANAEDPPGVQLRSTGFRVCGQRLSVSSLKANSRSSSFRSRCTPLQSYYAAASLRTLSASGASPGGSHACIDDVLPETATPSSGPRLAARDRRVDRAACDSAAVAHRTNASDGCTAYALQTGVPRPPQTRSARMRAAICSPTAAPVPPRRITDP